MSGGNRKDGGVQTLPTISVKEAATVPETLPRSGGNGDEICQACADADLNPWSGHYRSDCRQCTARMASHAPEDRRKAIVGKDPALLELARHEYRRRAIYGKETT